MEWSGHRGCEAAESPRDFFAPIFKAGSALIACGTIIHRSCVPKARVYNSCMYSCICLVAERESRNKSGKHVQVCGCVLSIKVWLLCPCTIFPLHCFQLLDQQAVHIHGVSIKIGMFSHSKFKYWKKFIAMSKTCYKYTSQMVHLQGLGGAVKT